MKKRRKRIISSFEYGRYNHRSLIDICPCCREEYDITIWMEQAYIFVREIVGGKHGYVALISECPKCFESSWCHFTIPFSSYRDQFSEKWKEESQKVHSSRRVQALRDWKNGLCGLCTKLEDGEVDTTDRRSCVKGMGGAETECDLFEEVK